MLDLKETQEKLEDFETQITENEKLKANLEGKKETVIDQLESEFNVTEKADIKELIVTNEKEVEKIGSEIENKMEKLEDYDWEE